MLRHLSSAFNDKSSNRMKPAVLFNPFLLLPAIKSNYLFYCSIFFAGLLGTLGFAPFHLPGFTILSCSYLFYVMSSTESAKKSGMIGFTYGLGYFGLGVSWVLISIHDYGNLNYLLSGLITFLFIFYLSAFPLFVGYLFKKITRPEYKILNALLFSVLWFFGDYLRATLFTGFPWLLVGTTQIDTPLRALFPVLGIYGVGLICTFASGLLTLAFKERSIKRYSYIILFVLILITPSSLQSFHWTEIKNKPVSVGVIQANLAMRDKWDDNLFWGLLKYYERTITSLLGKELIVLPESAIPLPASYLDEYLLKINEKAQTHNSALVLGILQPTDESETDFYNSIISLGRAKGTHIKEHLVPFGEYIPSPFAILTQWLNIPPPNIAPGKKAQSLIKIAKHSIASLICYEIAYPHLLRQQMPLAEWIISISDNGWFGHSLASYQQLQMAQVLSLITGRFQILANNDGLSSIINDHGEIIDSLPPFSSGILQSSVFSASGITPWIYWSDYPTFIFCAIIFLFLLFLKLNAFQKHSTIAGKDKRRYS